MEREVLVTLAVVSVPVIVMAAMLVYQLSREVFVALMASVIPAAIAAALVYYNKTNGTYYSSGEAVRDWPLTIIVGLAVLLIPPIIVGAWAALRASA